MTLTPRLVLNMPFAPLNVFRATLVCCTDRHCMCPLIVQYRLQGCMQCYLTPICDNCGQDWDMRQFLLLSFSAWG